MWSPKFIYFFQVSFAEAKNNDKKKAIQRPKKVCFNVDANTDRKNTCIVGKLLARMKYENEELTISLNRVSGLHGGLNKEELYNPYIKIYLEHDGNKYAKCKTTCQRKTRNPVFNEFFKVVCASENS